MPVTPPDSPEPRREGEAPRHRSGNRARPVDDDDASSEDDLINSGNRASLDSLQSVRAALLRAAKARAGACPTFPGLTGLLAHTAVARHVMPR